MKLVIDANILFAALIKKSHTRHLILSTGWEFYIPEFLLQEFINNIGILVQKTKLNNKILKQMLKEFITTANIKIVSLQEFKEQLKKAETISPDPYDVHYFALAMKLNCSIWSNDKKMKEQTNVKVYRTEELSSR